MFVGMITFNQLCLKYVEVSFYLVARSLTIVFNVIFTYFILHNRTSVPVIGCLCVVISGFMVGSKGEANFSLFGTVFGVLSSTFVSLNSIMTKKVGNVVNNDSWTLAFYNNMNASFLFIPFIFIFGEIRILRDHVEQLLLLKFWFYMMIAGVFGFLIGIITIKQIQLTSPLTHNVVGTVKAALQTVLAFYIWGNEVTIGSVIGVILVLAGSLLYSVVYY